MLRSTPRPTLGWGRPIVAVFFGVLGPAVLAGLVLWLGSIEANEIAGHGLRFCWYVAACLLAAPLFAWIAVPLMTPLVRIAARRGWAGPMTMVVLTAVVGLPLAHVTLNGDLTGEAPEMIPVLATALTIQALCGWCLLRGPRDRKDVQAAQ